MQRFCFTERRRGSGRQTREGSCDIWFSISFRRAFLCSPETMKTWITLRNACSSLVVLAQCSSAEQANSLFLSVAASSLFISYQDRSTLVRTSNSIVFSSFLCLKSFPLHSSLSAPRAVVVMLQGIHVQHDEHAAVQAEAKKLHSYRKVASIRGHRSAVLVQNCRRYSITARRRGGSTTIGQNKYINKLESRAERHIEGRKRKSSRGEGLPRSVEAFSYSGVQGTGDRGQSSSNC